MDNKTLIKRLHQTDEFKNYAEAFEEITGAPLRVFAIEDWPPALREGCPNPFCKYLNKATGRCASCMEVRSEIESASIIDSKIVSCLGGLCLSGVPLRDGDRVVGFFEFGPHLLNPHAQEQVNAALDALEKMDCEVDREQLLRAYAETPAMTSKRHSALVRLLVTLSNHFSNVLRDLIMQENPAERDAITKAKNFIKENFSEEVSVNDVAEAVNLSAGYFSRIFKASTTTHFTDYLNRVRVAQAKQLLQKTNLQINEVALAVGYQSLPHFNRMFRKHEGASPRQVRKGLRRKNQEMSASAGDGASDA